MEKRITKPGFTLVELLIVVGIIGILSGVLLASFGGASESARAAKCLANMHNLAVACQSYGMNSGYYPLAASLEYSTIDESEGIRNAREVFHERKGWISWSSQGNYSNKPSSSQAQSSWFLSAYTSDDKAALHCLTNGALWKYVSGNADVYLCPSHVRKAKTSRLNPYWSYMMNAYFGGDVGREGATFDESENGISYGGLKRADRRLLFAELPFYDGLDTSLPTSDAVFQYKGLSGYGGESDLINFNHVSGKNRYAHVVYADGHVDKLMMPRNGSVNAEELGTWLCEGSDIATSGNGFERLTE